MVYNLSYGKEVMDMIGVGILVFVIFAGVMYLFTAWKEYELNVKKWSKANKIGLCCILPFLLIFAIVISCIEPDPNGAKRRKEYSDLEKENMRWSHEAYDYIHSGQAAKDMGYK